MTTHALVLPDYLDTLAIICGALCGGMAARRKGLDWLGVLIIAYCTGLGGGIVRDVLLQHGIPAFLLNPNYQGFALIGAVVAIFFAKGAARFDPAYEALDTFMIGVWVLLGCTKAENIELGVLATIFVGTVAATAGMLLRDVLCHDIPELVQPGLWYSLTALGAAITFTAMQALQAPIFYSQVMTIIVASALRLLSVHYGLRTPTPYDVSSKVTQVLHLDRA